ncbi:hypothetical protein HPB51_029677 [Rhipicephalus microplus]|uniref:Uncharacterized protein n=1 Tax=Rhipicephalus microplus TaxID=6941 RepID=A0A9J6CTL8_RHIMP|nr:hypothetical protein HPB51_029677 [Rhipicephalus microplus]
MKQRSWWRSLLQRQRNRNSGHCIGTLQEGFSPSPSSADIVFKVDVLRLELLARVPPASKAPSDEDCLHLAKKAARSIDEGPLFLLLVDGAKVKSKSEQAAQVRNHGTLLTCLFDPEEPRVVTTIFLLDDDGSGDRKKEVAVWRAATEEEARALCNFKDPLPENESLSSSPSDTLSSLNSLSSTGSSDSLKTSSSRQVLVAASRSASRDRRADARQREAPKVLPAPPGEQERSGRKSDSSRKESSRKLPHLWTAAANSLKRAPQILVRPAGNQTLQPGPSSWMRWSPPRVPVMCFQPFGRPLVNQDGRGYHPNVPTQSPHHAKGNSRNAVTLLHSPQRSMLRSGSLSSQESGGSDNEGHHQATEFDHHSRHRSKKVVTFNYMTKVQFM